MLMSTRLCSTAWSPMGACPSPNASAPMPSGTGLSSTSPSPSWTRIAPQKTQLTQCLSKSATKVSSSDTAGPKCSKFGLVPDEDFAAMIGVKVQSLKNRPKTNLPSYVRAGRRWLFNADSVRAYLEARREPLSFEDDVSFSPSIRRRVKK